MSWPHMKVGTHGDPKEMFLQSSLKGERHLWRPMKGEIYLDDRRRFVCGNCGAYESLDRHVNPEAVLPSFGCRGAMP